MITLTLPFHRKARIWLADLPQACFDAERVIERTFYSANPAPKNRNRVAVEVIVPKGARFEYGLLGGEVIPNVLGQLHAVVSATSSEGVLLTNSLAATMDEVRIGLPFSYARAVMEGISIAEEELAGLPSGELHFNCAAYGIAGSCVAIFRTLSTTVVKLLNLGESLNKQAEMVPFLQDFMTDIKF